MEEGVVGRAIVHQIGGGASRAKQIEKALGRPLKNVDEAIAIEKAHYIGFGEIGADGKSLAGVGNYTQSQINEKARVLTRAGFTKEERRKFMEEGVVGVEHFVVGYVVGGMGKGDLEREVKRLAKKSKKLQGKLDEQTDLNQSADEIMGQIKEHQVSKKLIDEIYAHRFAAEATTKNLELSPKQIKEYRSIARKLGFSNDSEMLVDASKREGIWKYSLDQLNTAKTMTDRRVFTQEEMKRMIQDGNADMILRSTPEQMGKYFALFDRKGLSPNLVLEGSLNTWMKHTPERLNEVMDDLESVGFSQSQINTILDSGVIAPSSEYGWPFRGNGTFRSLNEGLDFLKTEKGFTLEDVEKIPKSVIGKKNRRIEKALGAYATYGVTVGGIFFYNIFSE